MPGGRPRIEIDWKEFDKLAQLQCTLVEIASWFECSEDTIQRRVEEAHGVSFAVYYGKRSAKGKMSLRRMQFQTAEKGNATMQIWLGKQYLGQSDKHEEVSDKPIVVELKTRAPKEPEDDE